MMQSLCKEKRYEIVCLSFTRKVCYQVTRGDQTGLRKPRLDKLLSPVTFQVLAESLSQKSFRNEMRFQDLSFPPNPFFKDKHDFSPFFI